MEYAINTLSLYWYLIILGLKTHRLRLSGDDGGSETVVGDEQVQQNARDVARVVDAAVVSALQRQMQVV